MAAAIGLPADETRRVLTMGRHPVSLDRPVGESEDSCFGEFIEDGGLPRPEKAAGNELLREKIDALLKTLTYREREIIRLRYGLGDGYTYTLEEVGRIFKVTRERVRQIEAKAVQKLQHPVRSQQLEGFLEHRHGGFQSSRPEFETSSRLRKSREVARPRAAAFSFLEGQLRGSLARRHARSLMYSVSVAESLFRHSRSFRHARIEESWPNGERHSELSDESWPNGEGGQILPASE